MPRAAASMGERPVKYFSGSQPKIDRIAKEGNPEAIHFKRVYLEKDSLDFSFSGLKTSFLYNLRDWLKAEPDFIERHKEDLAASLEFTVVDILMKKLHLAAKHTGIKHIAVAGGVSANTGLRNAFHDYARRYGWTVYIPKFSYTTDNAAMIAITGYFKYRDGDFCPIDAPAYAKAAIGLSPGPSPKGKGNGNGDIVKPVVQNKAPLPLEGLGEALNTLLKS